MRPSHLLLAALALAGALAAASAHAATPPAQPKDGPGGAAYLAASVVKKAVGRASAATYVFHGTGAPPPQGRPVVVLLHGWGIVNPQAYGAWIEHLAREGYLVLFPRFQEVNRTRPADATRVAAGLVKDALGALATDAEAKPDLAHVALLGHLAGAPLAANLAAAAKASGLPVPKLVYAVMPGGIAHDAAARGIVLDDLGRIDPDTLLVAVIGDRDARAADMGARRILREATGVPEARKLVVRALSDDHGFPALSATLAAPAAVNTAYDGAAIKLPPDPPRDPKDRPPPFKWSADMALTGEQQTLVSQVNAARLDTLDYLAFWKTFDMAATAAFAGQDGAKLRTDAAFTDMGRWSDGWPVKRLAAETPKPAPARPAAAEGAPGKPAPVRPRR